MKDKVIIAGSRTFNDYDLLERTIDNLFGNQDIEIVSGCANGADKLGERYAKEYGIKVYFFPADWQQHGKKAGFIRNHEMAMVSQHLVAFWDGESRGTKMMIDLAKKNGLKTDVIIYKPKAQ